MLRTYTYTCAGMRERRTKRAGTCTRPFLKSPPGCFLLHPHPARTLCTDAPTLPLLGEGDFFGFPSSGPFFAAVGGNHQLPRRILAGATAAVHRGTRVISIDHNADAAQGRTWRLSGVGGEAAFHDTAEDVAATAKPHVLGEFDAVLVTDVSASFEGWHRASAGLPSDFTEGLRRRARVPLFACMVAFDEPLRPLAPVDGISFGGSDSIWFAARTRSKPGMLPGVPCQ